MDARTQPVGAAGRTPGRRPVPDAAVHPPRAVRFASLLEPPPPARPAPAEPLDGVRLLALASDQRDAHAALLRIDAGGGRDLSMRVLVRAGAVSVLIQAPDPACAAYLAGRQARLREELERAGLDLARLELGRARDRARDRG